MYVGVSRSVFAIGCMRCLEVYVSLLLFPLLRRVAASMPLGCLFNAKGDTLDLMWPSGHPFNVWAASAFNSNRHCTSFDSSLLDLL